MTDEEDRMIAVMKYVGDPDFFKDVAYLIIEGINKHGNEKVDVGKLKAASIKVFTFFQGQNITAIGEALIVLSMAYAGFLKLGFSEVEKSMARTPGLSEDDINKMFR